MVWAIKQLHGILVRVIRKFLAGGIKKVYM